VTAAHSKVAYPQVPLITKVMCDRKAAFNGAPKEGACARRKAHPTLEAGLPHKSPYINRVGKVRRLIYRPKFL